MDLIERPEDLGRRHPWELARARFFLGMIERLDLAAVTGSWLDVGAGDAWFAQQLRAVLPTSARLACWDVNYPTDPVAAAADTVAGLELTATRPPGLFDGILMLDVIEHVEDDVTFVRDIVTGSLASDGWVLVSVPAYQSLFCAHDRALKHFRRYSPAAIRQVLESAGLTVVARGGLFQSLLALRGLQVIRERYRPPAIAQTGVGAWGGGEALTKALTAVLGAEARMSLALGTRHLPVVPGLSTWAWCRRSGRGGR